jgi:hypothetical protein
MPKSAMNKPSQVTGPGRCETESVSVMVHDSERGGVRQAALAGLEVKCCSVPFVLRDSWRDVRF